MFTARAKKSPLCTVQPAEAALEPRSLPRSLGVTMSCLKENDWPPCAEAPVCVACSSSGLAASAFEAKLRVREARASSMMDVAQFTPAGARLSRYFQWKSRESAEPQGLCITTHILYPPTIPGSPGDCWSVSPLSVATKLHARTSPTWPLHVGTYGYVGGHTYTQKEKKKGTSMREPPPKAVACLSSLNAHELLGPGTERHQQPIPPHRTRPSA